MSNLFVCPASSDQFHFRALWVDTASYMTPDAADKVIEQCKQAKINVIIASVMVHGGLMHKSTHFQHKVFAKDDYDPLGYLIDKAHGSGIKVHAMYATYYEGVRGLTPMNPDWLCTDINGVRMEGSYFLSPQIPGVNDYLLSVIQDSLAYDIDGIQLDYIRYYGSAYDYSGAGRKSFIELYGFDPAHFMDAAERIVPPDKDPFSVRVLHPKSHSNRPWEVTWIESLMDRAGVGFGFISEAPSNLDALRAPGVLVISRLFDISPELTGAIDRYVKRGGSLIWLDCPVVGKNKPLAELLGITAERGFLPRQWRSMTPVGTHSLTKLIPVEKFWTSAEYAPKTDRGVIVARLNTGQPAVIVNKAGKGQTVLICFNAGSTDSDGVASLVHGTVRWLRSQSNVEASPDLLAAKRAQWVNWRAGRITDLVKRVHDALKAKDPNLMLSVAGGFTAGEYYTVRRSCRRWMSQGLIDFGNPMDYCNGTDDFRQLLLAHKRHVPADKLPYVYPGLGLFDTTSVDGKKKTVSRDASVLRAHLAVLREEGYRGFALFCSAQLTDEQIKVLANAAR